MLLQAFYPSCTCYATESGEIDLDTMEKQIDYLFAMGADGFCLALVSDLFRLSEEEKV